MEGSPDDHDLPRVHRQQGPSEVAPREVPLVRAAAVLVAQDIVQDEEVGVQAAGASPVDLGVEFRPVGQPDVAA